MFFLLKLGTLALLQSSDASLKLQDISKISVSSWNSTHPIQETRILCSHGKQALSPFCSSLDVGDMGLEALEMAIATLEARQGNS